MTFCLVKRVKHNTYHRNNMLPWQQSVQNLLKTHCTQTQHTHCNFRACGTWEGKHSEWRRERKWFRVHTKDCTGLHTYVHMYAMYVRMCLHTHKYRCIHVRMHKLTNVRKTTHAHTPHTDHTRMHARTHTHTTHLVMCSLSGWTSISNLL